MADTPESDASASNISRFVSQGLGVEDRLKADTVGLVQLSDFRKRRVEALEAQDGPSSDGNTPSGRESPLKTVFKKRKKLVKKGGLSFDDENDEGSEVTTPRSQTPASTAQGGSGRGTDSEALSNAAETGVKRRGLLPNTSASFQPKAMTKSAMLREQQLKDELKKEFTQIQEAVRATEFILPFVFYDGKNVSSGSCRMKKGDPVWLLLERARKAGADLAGKGDKSKRDWARISVDDLMVVKGDIIIPHHYDFHYFILNRAVGYQGPLFPYSAEPTAATPSHLLPAKSDPGRATPLSAEESTRNLQTAAQRRQQAAAVVGLDDSELEGFDFDPSLTKVVDRRWYERNKHIYPASSWEEYDATRDYASGVRKDTGGNSMFFSR